MWPASAASSATASLAFCPAALAGSPRMVRTRAAPQAPSSPDLLRRPRLAARRPTARRARTAALRARARAEEDGPLQPQQAARRVSVASAGDVQPGVDADTLQDEIRSAVWDWDGFGRVRYLYARRNDDNANRDRPAILLIPGFGICASDFLQNIPALSEAGYRVYAMDKLGLGESVPLSREVALQVTVQVWRDQIIRFIEQKLDGVPVFLAGNSLGGLLCASVSSVRRDLVRGAILLSPAPFWVMVPPTTPALLRSALRALVRRFWSQLTNDAVVRRTLALVYARPENIPARTVEDILRPTRHEHAKHVFETILTSPGLEHGFEESIENAFADGDIPLAILYGRQDPWVVPMFGLRIKALVRSCAFYELSPCGHCPHAEVPTAVNTIMINWLSAVKQGDRVASLERSSNCTVVDDVTIYDRDHTPLNFLERFALGKSYAIVFMAAYISTFLES